MGRVTTINVKWERFSDDKSKHERCVCDKYFETEPTGVATSVSYVIKAKISARLQFILTHLTTVATFHINCCTNTDQKHFGTGYSQRTIQFISI